jgi:NitT/TauT family transport system permease protein
MLRLEAMVASAIRDNDAPGDAAPPMARPPSRARRAWSATWPRLAALALLFLAWQLVVWSGWRPEYVLPGPATVLQRLFDDLRDGTLPHAVAVTLRRAAVGYAIAFVVGTTVGLALARVSVVRAAAGPLITGLQSMPSVAWFPLAILLFQLSEAAILFVVVLGAAPSIANGVLAGVDNIPPLLLRAGRVLGARGPRLYRHVLLPAALPGFVAGLKQGWAFAWRSLMAGELLVIIANRPSLGVRLQFARELSDAEGLLAAMLIVLAIGIAVDSFVFGPLEQGIRKRRGLVESTG